MNLSDFALKIESIRKNKKIVFTNGCFDILHIGHTRYLEEAKSLGDILIVGLDSDEGVRKLKGKSRPIQSEEDRKEILKALAVVDYVHIFDDGDPRLLIKTLKPDILVKGGDWTIDKILGSDFVLSYGGEVKSLSFISGKSTTEITNKLKS